MTCILIGAGAGVVAAYGTIMAWAWWYGRKWRWRG